MKGSRTAHYIPLLENETGFDQSTKKYPADIRQIHTRLDCSPVLAMRNIWLWFKKEVFGLRFGVAEQEIFRSHSRQDLRTAAKSVSSKSQLYPPHVQQDIGWRLRFAAFLESHTMHLVILLLVFIDVLAVFGETMLHSICEPDAQAKQRVENWVTALGWVSKGALILMLLQQVFLILCLGMKYFRKCFYVIDLIVLSVALVIEIVLHDVAGGWLALLLTWRVIRLLHGFAVQVEMSSGTELLQEEIRQLKDQVQWLEEQLRKAQSWSTDPNNNATGVLPYSAALVLDANGAPSASVKESFDAELPPETQKASKKYTDIEVLYIPSPKASDAPKTPS